MYKYPHEAAEVDKRRCKLITFDVLLFLKTLRKLGINQINKNELEF